MWYTGNKLTTATNMTDSLAEGKANTRELQKHENFPMCTVLYWRYFNKITQFVFVESNKNYLQNFKNSSSTFVYNNHCQPTDCAVNSCVPSHNDNLCISKHIFYSTFDSQNVQQ